MRIVIFIFVALAYQLSNAFEYNTDMIGFNGGVISQLNNCGVSYTASGRYLWGAGQLTTSLQSDSKTIKNLYNAAEGVLSVTDAGEAYFSPDGRYLAGGGNTRYLGKYSDAGAYGNTIVLQNRSTIAVRASGMKTTSTIKAIVNPGLPNEAEKTVIIVKASSSSQPNNSYFEFVGAAYGELFFREVLATARYGQNPGTDYEYLTLVAVKDISDLSTTSGSYRHLHKTEKTKSSRGNPSIVINSYEMFLVGDIKKILPYRGGLLTYTDDSIILSSDLSNAVVGDGTSVLNTSDKKIASVLPRGGDEEDGAKKGLLVTYQDGTSFSSPDGNNLTGGGRSSQLTSPFDTARIKEELNIYLNNERSDFYYTQDDTAFVDSAKIAILNKGSSAEFAGNFFIGKGGTEGFSAVSALVSKFNGEPALVRIYDKGWSGWEYDWRDRGTREGLIDHSYNGSTFGDLGIKVKAENECTIVVALETIGGVLEPFEFTWDLNADNSFSTNNNQSGSTYWNQFAEGEPSFSDFYPKTLLDRIVLTVYEIANKI